MTDRLERLTNLVATLLDTRRPLTLEEIVDLVPGYPDDKLSYRRQFEAELADPANAHLTYVRLRSAASARRWLGAVRPPGRRG